MDQSEIDDILELPGCIAERPVFERVGNAISEDEAIWLRSQLIEQLSAGVDERRVIYDRLRINRGVIRKWCKADDKFAGEFAEAEELHRQGIEHALLHLHDLHESPQMAKVHSDNVKWVLGVQDRQRYGTKVEVSNTTEGGLIDVLRAAIERIPRPSCDLKTIEHEATLDPKGLLAPQ